MIHTLKNADVDENYSYKTAEGEENDSESDEEKVADKRSQSNDRYVCCELI